MAIPNPNPNIEDGKKCDNKTYSSNKIESLIKTATELPIPEAGDAGKVLTVNSDSDGYELDTPVAPTSIIDDTAAAADKVYSSSKVDTLLSGKVDISKESTTLTEDTSGSVFHFNRDGDLVAVYVSETAAQVQLPNSWTNIGTISNHYYGQTSGTIYFTIPTVSGHYIDANINMSNGAVSIKADVNTNIWAQGSTVYMIY